MTSALKDHEGHQVYSPLAKWLHWLIASLILVQYLLIQLAELAESANLVVKQLGIIANHKSIGITILLIAIVRLVFRTRNSPPPLPTNMPNWQVKASNLSHLLLYFCLFALPISGWLMSSASAYSVSWFNLVALPDLITANKENAQLLSLIHELLSDALVILAAVHILAALKHHIIDKDDVMSRMLGKSSLAISCIAGLALTIALGGLMPNKRATTDDHAQIQKTSSTTNQIEHAQSNLPIWSIDYKQSHIKFTGEQAGAEFTGQWNQWQGTLQFDSEKLDDSRFDVSIDINSVASDDDERDQTILSSDFFDVITFPAARFQAKQFSATATGFLANGHLTIKGISHPTKLAFQISQTGSEVILNGTATLDRHAWQLGIGDWADPTWVGSEVTVNVLVKANN